MKRQARIKQSAKNRQKTDGIYQESNLTKVSKENKGITTYLLISISYLYLSICVCVCVGTIVTY
jgi:hypothetical protein